MVIRRIGVGSAAKIAGVLYAVIGLIVGCMLAIFSLFAAGMGRGGDDEIPAWIFGPIFGVGALIFAPIFYGVIGIVVGTVVAAVYNLASGIIGGLQIDVE